MAKKPTEKKTQQTAKSARLWPRTIAEAARQATQHLARYSFAQRFVVDKNVCDVACGVGYGSSFLAKTAQKVTAMDISPEAIEWASKYFSRNNTKFLVADAAKPWPVDDKFDVIASFETMEHLEDPEIFLKHVYSHLLPSGVLVLSVSNGPRDRKKTNNPYHLQHFSDAELKALIQKCFTKAEFFSQAYKKDIKHYGSKFLRKIKLLKKQPYFVGNYFLVPGLCNHLKTWVVIAHKQNFGAGKEI